MRVTLPTVYRSISPQQRAPVAPRFSKQTDSTESGSLTWETFAWGSLLPRLQDLKTQGVEPYARGLADEYQRPVVVHPWKENPQMFSFNMPYEPKRLSGHLKADLTAFLVLPTVLEKHLKHQPPPPVTLHASSMHNAVVQASRVVGENLRLGVLQPSDRGYQLLFPSSAEDITTALREHAASRLIVPRLAIDTLH